MKLETLADVLDSIKKNAGRPFHLLLGNGFSVAYDPAIFSYNALHSFVTKLNDGDLSKVLEVGGYVFDALAWVFADVPREQRRANESRISRSVLPYSFIPGKLCKNDTACARRASPIR